MKTEPTEYEGFEVPPFDEDLLSLDCLKSRDPSFGFCNGAEEDCSDECSTCLFDEQVETTRVFRRWLREKAIPKPENNK